MKADPLFLMPPASNKFFGQLAEQLQAKKVQIELSPAARQWLADNGYDKVFGARPMARLIQSEIKRPLADAVLFGELQNGGKVVVEVVEGKLKLRFGDATPA